MLRYRLSFYCRICPALGVVGEAVVDLLAAMYSRASFILGSDLLEGASYPPQQLYRICKLAGVIFVRDLSRAFLLTVSGTINLRHH